MIFFKFPFFSVSISLIFFGGLFHVRFLDSDNIFEKYRKFYTKAIFLVSKVILNSKILQVSKKKFFLDTSESLRGPSLSPMAVVISNCVETDEFAGPFII